MSIPDEQLSFKKLVSLMPGHLDIEKSKISCDSASLKERVLQVKAVLCEVKKEKVAIPYRLTQWLCDSVLTKKERKERWQRNY